MPQPSSRHTVTFNIGDQPVPGYRLTRELGRGTFGVVWLAVTENGFERALKIVNLEQKGGKKEFRALRLIKDRKILHGNLLTLIDYWLLDRDGTIISSPNQVSLDTQLAPPKSGDAVNPGTLVTDDRATQAYVKKLTPGIQGTMMPGQDSEAIDNFSVRETCDFARNTDTTTDENSNALWLVVAMELGHKTLHDRQKEFTQLVRAKAEAKGTKHRKTRADHDAGTAGANTVADRRSSQQGNDDEDLAPLPAEEVLPYMEQAARGLDYLHRCEIVHRDVKPQNIMLVGDVAKVCDYGLASELGDIRATTNAFTLPYAAPEAINKNQPTPASDQYSLAVTYVELRTGRWPFVSNTSTAVYAAKDTGHHHLKFVRNRNVRAVLKKALSKRPEDRYPTCGEFVKQLAKAEATTFNLLATLQTTLAVLALVAALLAMSAIHPRVRGAMLAYVPDSWKGVWQSNSSPTFDVAEFRASLDFAEKLFKSDREAALESFEMLYNRLEHVPPSETELRDRVLIGLARAMAGQPGYRVNAIQRAEVLELMNKVSIPSSTPINGERSLQTYYLRYISDREFPAVKGVDPDAELAKSALMDWELQLWREVIADDIPADTQYVSALEKIIALRKDGKLSASLQELQSLQQKLADDPNAPDELRQRIRLEEIHLRVAEATLDHDHQLRELQDLVAAQAGLEARSLERVQLLRLLLLVKKHQGRVTYANPEVAQCLVPLKQELFDAKRLDGLHFSREEIRELMQCKETLKDEIRSTTDELAARSFVPLVQLCSKREAYQLLVERLRGFLASEDPSAVIGVIRLAAADLSAYLEREDLASEFTSAETLTANRDRADLQLEVRFVDPEISPEVALKDFVDQVITAGDPPKWFKRLLDKAADPKWTAAAVDPLRYFVANPPQDLAQHPQFVEWQRKLDSLRLRDTWLVDPSDPAAIQKILDSLKANSDSSLTTISGPLPKLLELECEILSTKAPTADKFRDWDSRLEQALFDAETDPELAAYGKFVRARRLALSPADSEQDKSVQIMDEILTAATSHPWLTKSRLQSAGDVLAVGAIRGLNVKDSGILRLEERPLPVREQIAHWQTITSNAGLKLPALSAVAAIVQATRTGERNWAAIRRETAAAKQDPRTVTLFENQQAGRVLDYVAALSDLNATPETSLPSAAVVQAFQRLLAAKEKNQYLYFDYSAGESSNDERVLQYLVNPVLNRLANVQDMDSLKDLPAKELAFLWGARGRLLQRNPLIIRVDPAREKDDRDSTVVATVQANQAFNRARQLDNNVEYLVGYCRTLITLPDAPRTRRETLEEIARLISERTQEERETNLGLRFLVAYTKRFQAYLTDSIPEIEAAAQLYKQLLDDLPAADPLGLLPWCREGLSDIHLRLGFLHENVTAREVNLLLQDQTPPPNTKAYHLKLAVTYGHQAVEISERSLNENAYIALGNAYEDYAYYLGKLDAYETSRDYFKRGIASANNRGLPLAKAKLNLGRCAFRQATDRLIGLDSNERKALLEESMGQLQDALDSETLRPEDEVEANLWLAEARWALGNLLTGTEKSEKYEESMQAYQAATTAAQKHKLTKLQMVTMSRESDARIRLQHYYTRVAPDIVRAPGQLDRARELDAAGYELFAADPTVFRPRYVMDLAGNSITTSPGDRQQQLRWLQGTPAIAKQWNANDEWRLAAVLLHLTFAIQNTEELAAARKILPSIENESVRQKALVRVLEFEAILKCANFNNSIEQGSKRLVEQAREAQAPLAAMMDVVKLHDQIRQGAIKENHTDIADMETQELLAIINSKSQTSLREFARKLTPIQKRKLYEALTNDPGHQFRQQIARLCRLMNTVADQTPELAAGKIARARLAHDMIKPFFVFNDEELSALALTHLTRDLQTFLDTFEKQLKEAGVNFD
jgi:serine/threonine protein kinase